MQIKSDYLNDYLNNEIKKFLLENIENIKNETDKTDEDIRKIIDELIFEFDIIWK